MKRRELLRRASAAVAVGAVAGCLSDPGEGGSGDDDTETGEPEETVDGETTRDSTDETTTGGDTPGIAAQSIATTNTDCRSSDDPETASVSFGEDQVDLTGIVGASDPCHEAAFESVQYDGDELVIVVGLSSVDDGCVQCEGVVEYEGSVGFDDGVPETVTVKHESRNEIRTVTTASP